MPRVSVIIPCYNRAVLICETIDSVRAQTFDDWEVIVVDDHSLDPSLVVAHRYARWDRRIHAVLRKGDRKGGNICRNQGFSLAKGDYIIFLDSDDLLSPTCIEQRVADMDGSPDCGFGVYQTELFKLAVGDRRVLWNTYNESSDLHRFLSLDTVWLTTGPIWRRSALEQLGGFDENVVSYQDWDLHVRALIAQVKYFKKAISDNFHRENLEKGDQITAIKERHPDHLKCHEALFERTFHSLHRAGLVDRTVRRCVAAMFWSVAKFWNAKKDHRAADKVWLKAAELGLCSHRRYVEGRIILRTVSLCSNHRLDRIIQRFWRP